ncbi:hypothetical protein GPECTOR_61g846 [Gonium pectorale]|uniref:Methyltransferase FkbM domain-containing protein n=1 Tax=Gonium pectorale TaxID=33097 RepID=A0A150G531_GONPE|nr:hypothetical protein GPECTOR_61g846 [Gonium pectorale]|eukprot:KXZ44893.1 hypothetical protein GPECTOR_61g846 [Gonium pectorale]
MYAHRYPGIWAAELLRDIFWALDYPASSVPGAGGGGSAVDQPRVFLDAGANFGWLSMNVAARGYRVVAVEAMKDNQQMLRNSLCEAPELMERTVLLALGLGNRTEHCFMYSTATNQGNGNAMCGLTREEVERAVQSANAAVRGEMTVHRLDVLLPDLDVQVMKIDVEGFEPLVMSGASQMLEAGMIKFVCLEFFPETMQVNMRNPNATTDFIEWLVRLPYRISILGFDRGYLTPEAARVALRHDRTRDDIFLAHKDLPVTAAAAAGVA